MSLLHVLQTPQKKYSDSFVYYTTVLRVKQIEIQDCTVGWVKRYIISQWEVDKKQQNLDLGLGNTKYFRSKDHLILSFTNNPQNKSVLNRPYFLNCKSILLVTQVNGFKVILDHINEDFRIGERMIGIQKGKKLKTKKITKEQDN